MSMSALLFVFSVVVGSILGCSNANVSRGSQRLAQSQSGELSQDEENEISLIRAKYAKPGKVVGVGNPSKALRRPASPKVGFVLQVATFREKANADRLVAKLRALKLTPVLESSEKPGRGVHHVVRLQSVSTRDEAERQSVVVAGATALKPLVRQE